MTTYRSALNWGLCWEDIFFLARERVGTPEQKVEMDRRGKRAKPSRRTKAGPGGKKSSASTDVGLEGRHWLEGGIPESGEETGRGYRDATG